MSTSVCGQIVLIKGTHRPTSLVFLTDHLDPPMVGSEPLRISGIAFGDKQQRINHPEHSDIRLPYLVEYYLWYEAGQKTNDS